MNLISNGGMYGAVMQCCQDVIMRDVWITNAGVAPTKNQLFFGTTVGSSNEYGRNLTIEDCVFDNNQSGYESILLAQAHNVRVINTTISNVPPSVAFGLLQYGSTQLSISGCIEDGADVRLDSWAATVTNCRFDSSRLRLTGVWGSKITGNIFDGGPSYDICGILVEAYNTGIDARVSLVRCWHIPVHACLYERGHFWQ